MIQSLTFNCKALKKNLDFQLDQIKERHISINEILVSIYQNYNRITIKIMD